MTRPGRLRRAGGVVVAGVTVVTVVVAGAPAATAAPAPVANASATLGPHGVVLTWTASGTGVPVVRDVTGLAPADYTTGRLVVSAPTSACPAPSCAYDTAYTNSGPATYAVWATDADGSASPVTTVDVAGPLPPLDTALSVTTSTTAVTSPHAFTLSGVITRSGAPLASARVTVLSRVLGSTSAAVLTTLTSGLDGAVRLTYAPRRSRTYQLAFSGDAYSKPTSSAVRTVVLVPHVTAAYTAPVIAWRQTTVLRGGVSPSLPGALVTVQRRVGTTWEYVTRRSLSTYSTWSLALSPAVGKYAYRAVLPGTAAYATGVSTAALLTVVPRTLYQGLSGSDVLALERRLSALHYDVGRIDGYFDYDLRHAVIAFEKVERLPRTGEWTSVDRSRAVHPVGFALLHPRSGLAVEVDITRQVLVVSRGGVVVRIVDVSTGSEQVYYQQGVRNVAHTPRGVFRIYFKVDGMRISPLGELWRPSFFYKGFAIHGNGSVPVYPASHGCVRITDSEANRLFSTLAIGTLVYVYDE